MLAEQVKSGAVPPLEDRLPEEPLVVEPTEPGGRYGGSLRQAMAGPTQGVVIYLTTGYDPLVRWKTQVSGAPGTEDIEPNVAKEYEISDDGTVVTFRLRPGMKWSDGEPFTADDVVFAVEDVLLNKELNPTVPAVISVNGQPASIEKVDDYSFKLIFPAPAGLFLQWVAHPLGEIFTATPRHYLEKFHKTYNPRIAEVVEEEGFTDWVEMFGAKRATRGESSIPTLCAWHIVTPVGDGARAVVERNPYYWKVDPNGNQLPYIDQMVFDVGVEPETMLLQFMNGDLDVELVDGRFTTAQNKPVLARDRETGDYRFIDLLDTTMNIACIHLNMTHPDPAKREVFGNKDFRIGLSHAINRQEIVDVVMLRQAEPYQAAPVPESVFYDEEFATQYTEFDIELANDHLDRVVPDKDSDGFRVDSSGRTVSFTLDVVTSSRPFWADIGELLQRYWRDVGLDVRYEVREQTFLRNRTDANEHEALIGFGNGGLDVLIAPRNYVPDHFQSHYARLWANWYSGTEPSEEPPETTKRQLELYDQVKATIDATEQGDLMREILEISKDQFYVIGTARKSEGYFVASNRVHGIPEPMLQGWTYATPSITNPEQYFIT